MDANDDGRGANEMAEALGPLEFLQAPTPVKKIDLRDAHAIRRELASLYRDARSGRVEPQVATRLAYILDLLRRAYESSELQVQIEMLERSLHQRRRR